MLSFNIQANSIDNLKTIGSGYMKFFFLKIYEIELKNTDGLYKEMEPPLALNITYNISVDKEDLIDKTAEEWQRQEIEYQDQWLDNLSEIWPDVNKDDSLAIYLDEKSISHFYFNNELLGSIKDPNFGYAFLKIWLADTALKPKLRNKLIGIT